MPDQAAAEPEIAATRHSGIIGATTVQMPPVKGPNWRAIGGIIRKDIRAVTQSKGVMLPLIIVPLVIVVLVPVGLALALRYYGAIVLGSGEFDEMLATAMQALGMQNSGYTSLQILGLFVLRQMFAPLFLILPIMAATVVAADAFAGEKERKTLEALLYTPTSDFDLFLAKAMGALIPAVVMAWGIAILNWIAVDIAAWPIYHAPILPNLSWFILAMWVAPAAAAVGLGATVIASAHAKTLQDAQQIGGFVLLPVILLMVGQSAGFLILGALMTFLAGLVMWVIASILLLIGVRTLRRDELLARI